MNIKTAGKEALRDGKSLHLSGHVCNLQVHGVHVDSPYCFIRCKAVRETSVSLPPYDTWIIVHKRRNIIVDGYCSCPGGIQGTCKHIAALCHTVIETVARGDNKAVTEKVQAWHAPSKKPHKPDFVKDITIRKVKGDCGLEEDSNHTKRTRYNNDPRAVEDRQDKTLQDLDLEGLRVATNGSAGILAYVQFGSNESEMPDVEHVVNEEVVTNAEYICMPDLPKTLPEIAQEASSTQELFQLATTPVSEEVVNIIRETTKDQTQSDSWFKYRQGRITASNLYEAVRKVRSDETVSEQNTSFLKKVMDYGPRPYAPAIYWGQYNEKSAVDKFVKLNRRHHKKLRADACGTVLCAEYPFLSASPDAVITCTCCGVRPLEVKNPYTNRHLSINKFAELPDTCLDITSTGKIRLNACHSYYYQVQAQILCLQADSGYFALQTACAYNNFHWEEICLDPEFLEEVISKSLLVFQKVIVEELVHENVKKTVMPNIAVITLDQTSSAAEYICKVCQKECKDEPERFEEMSIYCDYCHDWFHWICVDVTGKETFLKKKKLKWKCKLCMSND